MSQRQLAANLGVSLIGANYCMKGLVEKGWVKLVECENLKSEIRELTALIADDKSKGIDAQSG